MGMWPPHIDRFERKYDKAFVKDPLFRADLMDRIHKRVQVFLHSCNTTSFKYVESGDLSEIGGIQMKVERGKWLTSTSGWVDRPNPKEEGQQKTRQTWEWSQVKRWGRWTRRSFQHRSIPADADHEENGDNISGGTFIKYLLPLGGGW